MHTNVFMHERQAHLLYVVLQGECFSRANVNNSVGCALAAMPLIAMGDIGMIGDCIRAAQELQKTGRVDLVHRQAGERFVLVATAPTLLPVDDARRALHVAGDVDLHAGQCSSRAQGAQPVCGISACSGMTPNRPGW